MDSLNSTTPPRFHADLVMTPEVYADLVREQGALEVAQAFVIDSDDMADAANKELKAIKARIARVEEMRKGFVAPARQILAHADAVFEGPLKALEGAERFLKNQLALWVQKQRQLADEARRKREEEERKARQEAEARAAAARAKAAEEAEALRRSQLEAEERARKLAEEGRAKEAAKAAAEAAAAASRADAALENGEAKAATLVATAAAAVAAPIPEVKKLDGFSTRDNWVGELEPGKTEGFAVTSMAIAIASGNHPEYTEFLKIDWPAINRMAKALKGSMNVPGIVAVNRPVAASRSK